MHIIARLTAPPNSIHKSPINRLTGSGCEELHKAFLRAFLFTAHVAQFGRRSNLVRTIPVHCAVHSRTNYTGTALHYNHSDLHLLPAAVIAHRSLMGNIYFRKPKLPTTAFRSVPLLVPQPCREQFQIRKNKHNRLMPMYIRYFQGGMGQQMTICDLGRVSLSIKLLKTAVKNYC